MPTRVRELLGRRAAQPIVGRSDEIAQLLETFDQNAPLVLYLHGIAGIGKTSLLDAFALRARAR